MKQDDAALGDIHIVFFFPTAKVIYSYEVVRVLEGFGRNIDLYSVSNEFFQGDFICRLPIFREVDGRVEVSAPVLCGAKIVCSIVIAFFGQTLENRIEFKLFGRHPIDGFVGIGMGQIDYFSL